MSQAAEQVWARASLNHIVKLTFTMVVAAVSLVGCGITAIRPYRPATPPSLPPPELAALTVSVEGDDPRAKESAAEIIRRTQLFKAVGVDDASEADLTITVHASRHGIRCGTPQSLTVMTFGLVPTGNGYLASLDLEIASARSSEAISLEPTFVAVTKHGLWALPLRASKHWRKPQWGGDPGNLAALLREQLIAKESQLIALVRPSLSMHRLGRRPATEHIPRR